MKFLQRHRGCCPGESKLGLKEREGENLRSLATLLLEAEVRARSPLGGEPLISHSILQNQNMVSVFLNSLLCFTYCLSQSQPEPLTCDIFFFSIALLCHPFREVGLHGTRPLLIGSSTSPCVRLLCVFHGWIAHFV